MTTEFLPTRGCLGYQARRSKATSLIVYMKIMTISTDLLGELWCLDLHEAGFHSFHEASLVAKCDSARANGVFVAVSVYSSIDHAPKEVVHYVGKNIWRGGGEREGGRCRVCVTSAKHPHKEQ